MFERCPVRNVLTWIVNDFEHDICKGHNFGSHFASEALILCSIRWEWAYLGASQFHHPGHKLLLRFGGWLHTRSLKFFLYI